MSKKKQLSMFRTFLALVNNQHGHIRLGFGPRFCMDENNGTGGDGGGGAGGDANKNADGSYKPEFVEKLLKEKNNHRDAKVRAESELAELKKKLEGKGGEGDKGGEGKGGDDQTKELLRLKDEENKKLKDQLDREKKIKQDAMKIGALKQEFDKNGGNSKQFELITRLADTSKVLIDEDTGVVYGAETEIARIKGLAPEFFGKKKTGVNDGDGGSSDTHDHEGTGGESDVRKAVEGQRLKKDAKTGLNPLAAGFAAMGLKATDKR